MHKRRNGFLSFRFIALTAALLGLAVGGHASEPQSPKFVEGQIIVRFAQDTSLNRARSLLDVKYFEVDRPLVPSLNLFLVKLKDTMTVRRAISMLQRNHEIMYSQPDHIIKERELVPNDAAFAQQWSLSNPSKVDISATGAWDLGTGGKDAGGSEIVAAIVDGGVDITHPDIVDNLWKNPGEIPGNGKDDDGDGYVDDVNGWNAYNSNGTIPSAAHGTHVSGIVGARGNNAKGIAGINWNVKLMPIAGSSGTTSVIAAAYGFALAQKQLWINSKGTKGANVVVTNSSFGVDYGKCDSGDYPVWNDLYNSMGKAGILSAAATANLNIDVDQMGDVPTGCSSQYLVTVTNTTNQDERHSSAAYGKKTIQLGAPGTAIYSTVPGNAFQTMTGTSMATPHVTGAIAFLHSVASKEFNTLYRNDPAKGALVLKKILLDTVDKIPSLKGVTVSDGRLNLMKAAQAIAAYKP